MLIRSYASPSQCLTRHSEDPFQFVQRALHRTFDDLSSTNTGSGLRVRLDTHEDETAYHVTADLPGLSDKEVEITFDEGVLSLSGEKKVTRDDKGQTWHIVERSQGSFVRKLSFAHAIDVDKIAAKFEKGVLSVTLPKAAPAPTTSKKITIQ